MAITSTIVYTNPVGSSITVSQLDDSDRLIKTEVKERMEESIIDTSVATWADTTAKQCRKGWPRIFTDTLANKGSLSGGLYNGKLFWATNGDNTDSFDVVNGAAWTPVTIGTSNLLANAVTAAKITDANVTTSKIAASSVTGLRANLTNVLDDIVTGVTPAVIGTTSGTDFTATITPNSSTSIFILVLIARPSLEAGGGSAANEIGLFDFTHDNGGTTVIDTFRTRRRDGITFGNPNERDLMTCISAVTGLSGSTIFQARMYNSAAGQLMHLEGDDQTAKFMIFELMK